MKIYDVAIAGAGPAGISAALEARKRGLSALLIEQKQIGGVCLNCGCVPTKILLHAVKELRRIRENDPLFGIQADNLHIALPLLRQRIQRTIFRLRSGREDQLKKSGTDLVFDTFLRFSKASDTLWHLHCQNGTYSAKNLILALGGQDHTPSISGISKVLENGIAMHSSQAWDFHEVPRKTAVIGSGAAGLEYASIFAGLGSEVFLFEAFSRLGGYLLHPETAAYLKSEFEKRGIRIFLHSEVKEISSDGGILIQGERTLFDKIILAAGTRPLDPSIFASEAAVSRHDCSVCTNLPGIYIAGDMSGKNMTADAAEIEGITAIRIICGEKAVIPSEIPIRIYSDPEILIEKPFFLHSLPSSHFYEEKIALASLKNHLLTHPKDQGFQILIRSSGENKILSSITIGEDILS